MYPVIADPPVEAGADHVRFTTVELGRASVSEGAPGTVRGVTETAFDAAPAPTAVTARIFTL